MKRKTIYKIFDDLWKYHSQAECPYKRGRKRALWFKAFEGWQRLVSSQLAIKKLGSKIHLLQNYITVVQGEELGLPPESPLEAIIEEVTSNCYGDR